MKFSTALSIISLASGAFATPTNHEMGAAAGAMPDGSYGYVDGSVGEGAYAGVDAELGATAPAEQPAMTYAATSPAMVHDAATLVAPPEMSYDAATVTAPPAYDMATAAPAAGAAHTVTVGGSGLVFSPPEIIAAVGDKVTFVFLEKNHTVTQSTFDKPCVKNQAGEDSGFMPNPTNDTATAPTFDITVDTLEPTWWYCKQKMPKPHCGSGMVFAINPTAEKSFAIFQEMAKMQNGTEAAAPPPTDTGAAATGTAPITLSVDNGGVVLPTSTEAAIVAPPVATETVVAPGWNAGADAKACNCACFCGVGSFPAGDGVGAYGGYAGSLPAPWG